MLTYGEKRQILQFKNSSPSKKLEEHKMSNMEFTFKVKIKYINFNLKFEILFSSL